MSLNLWEKYYEYLIELCNLMKYEKFKDVLWTLHRMSFNYVLERDENREDDGIELRVDFDFGDEYRPYDIESFYKMPCSVLEMLVALAIRVTDEYIGDPRDEHPECFFVEMLENLGLDKMTGRKFDVDEVIEKVEDWLNRDFCPDGVGSPFPVQNDRRDQRELEIWDQMLSYINENYN